MVIHLSGMLTVVKIRVVIILVVITYTLVSGYQHFGATYCLHLQGRKWKQYVPSKLIYQT
jgi:hypothetical protein